MEVELSLCSLLEIDRLNLYLHGEQLLTDEIYQDLLSIIKKRATRYPLQYILQESWFYGRKFFVSPAVMVPTPETELLCESGIRFITENNITNPKILDIGCGSGVISITMASELKEASIAALDISTDAIEVAKRNAESLEVSEKIEFRESNLFSAINKKGNAFDLIMSNPPYISEEEYKTLPPEVLADPKISLTSGEEGLDIIKDILDQAPDYLKENGKLMFEIGYNQAERVLEISSSDMRYSSIVILKDLNEIDRVAILSLN